VIVKLDEEDGKYLETFPKSSNKEIRPENHGWLDDTAFNNRNGSGKLYCFAGLSVDDL
jgi:hypothetical protein